MDDFQRFFPARKLESLRTPCFVYSRKALETQLNTVTGIFRGIMPTEIVYPYKTNPFIAGEILKMGTGLLVSTFHDLRILAERINASAIYYYNPHCRGMEIKEALKLGVGSLILDSREQVEALLQVNPVKSVNILLRINTGIQIIRNAYLRDRNFRDTGFGIPVEDAPELFGLLSIQRFTKSLGIHSYIGTQNCDIDSWKENAERLLGLAKRLKRKGIELRIIDLGGGFPVDYREKTLSMWDIFSVVKRPVTEIKKLYPDIRLILETGRFLAAPSCVLLAEVIAKKKNRKAVIVSLNSSVYAGSMDTLIAGLSLPVRNLNSRRKRRSACIIRGSTPDTIDIFCREEMNEPDIGDKMAFLNAGAYNFSSDFCTLRKPENVWID